MSAALLAEYPTVGALAGDWAWMDEPGMRGFLIEGSPVHWEEAEYLERPPRGKEGLVRIAYLSPSNLRTVARYVDPDTKVTRFCYADRNTTHTTPAGRQG